MRSIAGSTAARRRAHQPRLAREGEPPELPRDEHGNATGGIRLPDLEAPLGTHVGQSPRDGFVQLMGTSTPFPPEKVRALYPDQAAWFARYRAATEHLVETGVFLPDDAEDGDRSGLDARAPRLIQEVGRPRIRRHAMMFFWICDVPPMTLWARL